MKDQIVDNRNEQHWKFPYYRQRMTSKEWRQLLLNGDDKIIFRGRMAQLEAKNLGSGVYEVYKEGYYK